MSFKFNEHVFLENFQVFRLRENVVSFFRSLLLSYFGEVDTNIKIYIPDVDYFRDKKSNVSALTYSDINKSIVNITRRFSDLVRRLPFLIIFPGVLTEKRNEISGDNLHFFSNDGEIYGSAGEMEVLFYIGAEDEQTRVKLSDVLYIGLTQLFRKNYIYTFENSLYSILIKNDSVKMSSESEVDVSDMQKIYTVALGCNIFLEWQLRLDYPDTHIQTDFK